MENWLSQQVIATTENWSSSISRHYPEHAEIWSNPKKFLECLDNKLNTLEAVKYLDWSAILKGEKLKILDLGCGTGWLSAYLSTFNNVTDIDALDSDQNLLKMLPEIVTGLKGQVSKINPINALFSPILRSDQYYDYIVSSSSLHHADNLYALARELFRGLKKGGKLVILNENPYRKFPYLLMAIKKFVAIVLNIFKGKSAEYSITISKNGIVYDPYLGDKTMTFYQWEDALVKAGFQVKKIITPFATYKEKNSAQDKLVHFICQK